MSWSGAGRRACAITASCQSKRDGTLWSAATASISLCARLPEFGSKTRSAEAGGGDYSNRHRRRHVAVDERRYKARQQRSNGVTIYEHASKVERRTHVAYYLPA